MNKTQDGGFIFVFDEPERARSISEKVRIEGHFSDTISCRDLKPNSFEICFISFDGNIIETICLLRLGHAVATAKNRILFSNLKNFPQFTIDKIQSKLSIDLRRYLIRSSSGYGQKLTGEQWIEFLDTILQLQPEAHATYNELQKLKQNLSLTFHASGFDIVAQEKDMIGLSLDIFGVDREEILFSWAPVSTKEEAAPFINGLHTNNLREDSLIIRDSRIFDNWTDADKSNELIGILEFTKGDQRLTIANFNRHKVEQNTGVDLIYYNHKFNSYIMVQYKRMCLEKESVNKRRTRDIIIYRPTDDSYTKELKRMKEIEDKIKVSPSTMPQPSDYRLHANPFYFKLCLPFHLELSSTELIKGMYFPLDYWEQYLNSDLAKGKNGGLRIVYQDSDRHINNTLFVDLVQHGWIGSRLNGTSIITELIRESLEQQHSMTLAVSSESPTDTL